MGLSDWGILMISVHFYSDLHVKVAGKMLSAHKFVLAARSDAWSLANLASTAELDLSGERSWGEGTPSLSLKNENHFIYLVDCKPEVAMAMLRWVYTDELELTEDDAFLIDLMKLANRFQLQVLRERSVPAVALQLLLSLDGSDAS